MIEILAILAVSNEMNFVPSGMTAKMGGYSPIRADMTSTAPAGINKAPVLKAPMYGQIGVGDKKFAFVLDEPAGETSKLYVDSNGNGNLTDDPASTWEGQKSGQFTMMRGTCQVMVDGKLGSLGVYRFDKTDPQRAQLKDVLLYYYDFGYQGKMAFGNETYSVATAGPLTPASRFWVDRNANGKSDGRSESVGAGKPFNFGGTTYEFGIQAGSLKVNKSAQTVAEIPLPPDLSVGKDVPRFEATSTDGTKIQFPSHFKGKIVLMDFWATWCGPCIAELPNLKKAYAKYHDQGLEVLGISFDREGDGDKLAKFTKDNEMPWLQIFEGKFWDTTIGRQFGVEAIPFVLLVDCDTGKILATVRDLRGEALEKTLGNVVAQRRGQ